MRWVGDGAPLDLAQCEYWIEVTKRNYETYGYGMFALVERAADTVVGFCGLVHPGGQREAELKYALCRSAWGRGLASEAAAAMLAIASSAFALDRVIATTAPENTASHRVLMKAGMHRGAIIHEEDGTETLLFAWQAGEPEGQPRIAS
ncbi:GNAT family N-acetyltransferase [Pseudoxanthomonas japonensis]|uniref:GNAT family N-acetyltransferase n=1 Tax=Pseudoxanthomonas japonensis TaxID=69284 RepID=UPI003D2F81E2